MKPENSITPEGIATNLIEKMPMSFSTETIVEDLNRRDKEGRTPLHHAASEGNLERVKLLLRQGSDANLIDRTNLTPKKLAELNKHTDIAALLNESQASLASTIEDSYNDTLQDSLTDSTNSTANSTPSQSYSSYPTHTRLLTVSLHLKRAWEEKTALKENMQFPQRWQQPGLWSDITQLMRERHHWGIDEIIDFLPFRKEFFELSYQHSPNMVNCRSHPEVQKNMQDFQWIIERMTPKGAYLECLEQGITVDMKELQEWFFQQSCTKFHDQLRTLREMLISASDVTLHKLTTFFPSDLFVTFQETTHQGITTTQPLWYPEGQAPLWLMRDCLLLTEKFQHTNDPTSVLRKLLGFFQTEEKVTEKAFFQKAVNVLKENFKSAKKHKASAQVSSIPVSQERNFSLEALNLNAEERDILNSFSPGLWDRILSKILHPQYQHFVAELIKTSLCQTPAHSSKERTEFLSLLADIEKTANAGALINERIYLQLGSKIDEKEIHIHSLLHDAVALNAVNAAKHFLTVGPMSPYQDKQGAFIPMGLLMIENMNGALMTPVGQAIESHRQEILTMIIEECQKRHMIEKLQWRSKQEEGYLGVAIRANNIVAFQQLSKADIALNQQEYLALVKRAEHSEVWREALLQIGTQPLLPSKPIKESSQVGAKPTSFLSSLDQLSYEALQQLCDAAASGELEIVKWLIGEKGITDPAQLIQKKPSIKLLQGKAASLINTELENRTPFHYAVTSNNIEVVKLLIKFGANIHQPDSILQKTPLQMAKEHDQKTTVEYLKSKGAGAKVSTKRASTNSANLTPAVEEERKNNHSVDQQKEVYGVKKSSLKARPFSLPHKGEELSYQKKVRFKTSDTNSEKSIPTFAALQKVKASKEFKDIANTTLMQQLKQLNSPWITNQQELSSINQLLKSYSSLTSCREILCKYNRLPKEEALCFEKLRLSMAKGILPSLPREELEKLSHQEEAIFEPSTALAVAIHMNNKDPESEVFGGVGLSVVQEASGAIRILYVFESKEGKPTPAERKMQKLQQQSQIDLDKGVRIVAVAEGVQTKECMQAAAYQVTGSSLLEVQNRVRGPIGQKVSLLLEFSSEEGTKQEVITLKRNTINRVQQCEMQFAPDHTMHKAATLKPFTLDKEIFNNQQKSNFTKCKELMNHFTPHNIRNHSGIMTH